MSAPPYLPVRWRVSSPDVTGVPGVLPLLAGQSFVLKTPSFNTRVQGAQSGRETRLKYWQSPRWKFSASWEVLRKRMSIDEYSQLLGFFCSAAGQFGQFNYFDPSDTSVTAQPFGTGDGTTVLFQLVRAIGGFVEPVYALNGPPLVTVNGTNTAVTVGANGSVLFSTAPASGALLAWTGSFFYVCRFNQDDMGLQQFGSRQWSLSKLEWMSLKP